jgi:hypothetical protein
MSLKAVHIIFITVATLFLAGFGVWSVNAYAAAGGGTNLLLAISSFAGAVGLPIYGVWFLKKTKGVGLV